MRLVIDVRHHHPRIEEQLMSISTSVQTAIDKLTRTQDLVTSLVAADKIRDQQIADLKAKIDALPTGTELSVDDKNALLAAAGEIDDINTALASAIPASTPFEGQVPPASDPNGPQGSQTGAVGELPADPAPSADPDAPVV